MQPIKDLNDIQELQDEGVLTELMPQPRYWSWNVHDMSLLPDELKKYLVEGSNTLRFDF